jgi:LysR family transcriptional regulator, transcriptional activator of nhaA
MAALNYHHLRYFWVIANEQNLTRAAERLHVSQSALSIQLKKLEESLGQSLFKRERRRLTLTDAGRIALEHANTIFHTGDELVHLLKDHKAAHFQVLRIGAVATLSRNFQLEMLKPLRGRQNQNIIICSGSLRELLTQLQTLSLDLIISNRPVQHDKEHPWHSHLLNSQTVSLVGKALRRKQAFRFPDDLQKIPLLLPSLENDIRVAFDLVMEQLAFEPIVVAEVDDMAMLRVLARDFDGLALVPPIVVQDELRKHMLVEHYRFPNIKENFYAITPSRRFPNPLVRELVSRIRQTDCLGNS